MLQHKLPARFPARMSAGLLTLGLLVASASPASAATTVSIAAPQVALSNGPVWIQGAVSGSSAGATVRILKYTNGAWNYAAQTTVKSDRKYAVKVTVTAGGNAFLAKAYGSKIATGYSKSVKVYGLSARGMILYKTNEYRKQQGRPALKGLSSLDTVAQGWSQHLADTVTTASDFQHHVKPYDAHNFYDHYQAGWTYAAENIAAGYTPTTVVASWINSAPHRANLLCSCTHIGIGYVSKPGSKYGTYFTQNFARY
jgi:uncharacterized protein YkwD